MASSRVAYQLIGASVYQNSWCPGNPLSYLYQASPFLLTQPPPNKSSLISVTVWMKFDIFYIFITISCVSSLRLRLRTWFNVQTATCSVRSVYKGTLRKPHMVKGRRSCSVWLMDVIRPFPSVNFVKLSLRNRCRWMLCPCSPFS